MPKLKEDDSKLRDILRTTQVIAVVGHSNKPSRTSYQIAQFLRSVGYTVYPVNPAVKEIDGQPSYPSLQAVPATVDLVNVFRRSEFLEEIVSEAIAINAKTVWGQLGVYQPIAEQKAHEAGINMIMDACIKVEYLRLIKGT